MRWILMTMLLVSCGTEDTPDTTQPPAPCAVTEVGTIITMACPGGSVVEMPEGSMPFVVSKGDLVHAIILEVN